MQPTARHIESRDIPNVLHPWQRRRCRHTSAHRSLPEHLLHLASCLPPTAAVCRSLRGLLLRCRLLPDRRFLLCHVYLLSRHDQRVRPPFPRHLRARDEFLGFGARALPPLGVYAMYARQAPCCAATHTVVISSERRRDRVDACSVRMLRHHEALPVSSPTHVIR